MKRVYTITFCDHIKNVKQILRKYDRVNWPLARPGASSTVVCPNILISLFFKTDMYLLSGSFGSFSCFFMKFFGSFNSTLAGPCHKDDFMMIKVM